MFFDFFAREWEGQNNGLRLSGFTGCAEAQRAARVRLMLGPSHWSEKTAPARIPRRGER